MEKQLTNTNLIVNIRLLFKRIKKKLTCPIFQPNFERRVLSSFFYSFNFEFTRLHFVKTLKNQFWSQNSKSHDVAHGWEWPYSVCVIVLNQKPPFFVPKGAKKRPKFFFQKAPPILVKGATFEVENDPLCHFYSSFM